ncbi:unnamed protein product [Sphagnum tenellum]
MEMQTAELQALCTRYNLKPAKSNKAATTAAIVNHLMVPRADVVTKQDVRNVIEVTMEQVAENILAPAMEAKIVTVTGQVEMLQNKVDAMAKSFDTMQDSGEKWKEVVGRKVDKVANKVDRATDVDLTELLDRLKVADRVQVQKVHRQMPSGQLDRATDKAPAIIITLASVHNKLTVLRARKGLQGTQIGLDEDLTPAQQAQKRTAWATFKEAKEAGERGVVGKHSGSIAVFVRETWANNTIVWKTAKDGTRIWLRLGNAFRKPLFLCIVYAAPQGSPYADNSLLNTYAKRLEKP